MALNYKRLALVLLFILVTVGLGVTIYLVFFRNVFGPGNGNQNVNGVVVLPNANGNRNVNVNAGQPGTLPNANAVPAPLPIASGGETRVLPLVETVPGGATLAQNGRDLLYYDPASGQFLQVSPDGQQKTLLTTEKYPAAENIIWSPQRDKAIIEFPDQTKYIYDFRNKRQYTLAPEMEDISFSPSADRISFKFVGDNPDDQYLVVSNFDGTGSQTVEPMADKVNQFHADWSPVGNIIGTFAESIDANRQRVIPLGSLSENFPAFNLPGRGYQGRWSPDGAYLLYSVFTKESAYNPQLYIADGRSDNFGARNTNLDLQTWPEKCTFGSNNTLFCAVPQYLEQGSALFPDLAKGIPDDIYRIDLTTGQKQLLAKPVDQDGRSVYTAQKLFLSADESMLYFFDSRTNKVNKIQLK